MYSIYPILKNEAQVPALNTLVVATRRLFIFITKMHVCSTLTTFDKILTKYSLVQASPWLGSWLLLQLELQLFRGDS